MDFLQPERLWVLAAVGLLVLLYGFMQTRRKVYAARLASADLFESVVPRRAGWRRHAASAVMLAALIVLSVGFAQPTRVVRVPRERATVIVAIDVSLSMEAADVEPDRLQAAQAAAKTFIAELPPTLNVGIVGFAGTASVLLNPTTDRLAAARVIDNLRLAESTAIGEAIFTSLDALLSVPPDDDGERAPARIVLLSDGVTTVGRPDQLAVQAAQQAQIPVSTIAFGTESGFILYDDPETEAVESERIAVPVGGRSLEDIADGTGGAFFTAESVDELDSVYENIGSAIGFEEAEREITDWFIGGGLVVLALASILNLLWFQRLI
jgi:Ca-activated chloride channel family protein